MQLGPVKSYDGHTFQWTVDSLDSERSPGNNTIIYGNFQWRLDISKFYKESGYGNQLCIEDNYAVRCFARPSKVYGVARGKALVYNQMYYLRFKMDGRSFWAVQVEDKFTLSRRLWIPGKLIQFDGFSLKRSDVEAGKISFELSFRGPSFTERNKKASLENLETRLLTLFNDADEFSDAISELLFDDDDCDVTLVVGERRFKAHRIILKSRSEVFKRMFENDMIEKMSGQVEISDCSPDAFEVYLRYVYSGKVGNLTNRTAMDLYYIANKYDAKRLSQHCVQCMSSNLTIDDIVDLVLFVLKNSEEKDLSELIVEFLAKNFKQICRTEKWKNFLGQHPLEANDLFERVYNYLLSYS